jgi:ubiquinone/menaquinone biosynthesis C-methylase UbiE
VGTGSACPEGLFDRAQARNLSAIQSGRVDLHRGFVESLPFDNDSFQRALAINSIQVWADPLVGLHEIRRVMKSEGMLALGFTPYSGQSIQGLIEISTQQTSQIRDLLTNQVRVSVHWAASLDE